MNALFEEAVDTMFPVAQIKIAPKSTALLQLSSCFGNHKASLLVATIYFSNMGHTVNQQQVESINSPDLNYYFIMCNVASIMITDNIDFCVFQGHVYSLIGALGDNRFALMHAGYKHTHGIDGFPEDLDVAYSYYSNAGAQGIIDSSRIHERKVCLNI